ncbi:hypothetical protein BH10BAC5_BH10BAC5_09140 [soil metagenome]
MDHIIFLHGALGSASQLQPLISTYKEQDQSLICHSFDLSGHGEKSDIENKEIEFSIQQFSNDLKNYINSIELRENRKIYVFGYSMGGYAALNLAKESPGIIDKIFTLGTKFYWNEEIAKNEIEMLDPEKIEIKIPKFANILKKRHSSDCWKKVLINTASLMNSLGKNPLLTNDVLKQINCKVRIAVGDRDNMVTIEESENASRVLNSGSFIVLSETYHPIEKVDLKRLCLELKDFFKN